MPLQIKPLTPALLNDWLHFFDNIAFTDNKNWADCYCGCYQVNCSNKEWNSRTKEQNRDWAQQSIKDGKMQGYLAFEDDKPVGWCNVNVKKNYPFLIREKELTHDASSDSSASIICFIIAPRQRGKGIARTLLRSIIDDFSKKNVTALEAYPHKGDQTPASQFHGPLQLYLSEGFSVTREFERFSVVTKSLKA